MRARRRLWLLYTLFIVYGGTIPVHFAGNLTAIIERAQQVQLNPLVSPDTGQRLSLPDVVQNVLLYVPFGALGMLGARPGKGFRRFARVTALGMALSAAVEMAQLFTVDRIASVADIVTNTAGTIAGASGFWWGRRVIAAAIDRLRAAGLADVAELRPLAIAATLIAVAYLQPFDITLEVGVISAKVRSLQSDIWQFTGLRHEGTSVMLSAFFAMTLASYLSALGDRRPVPTTIILAAGLVCALESAQLLVGSKMPALWDAMVGVVGVLMGTAIWAASSILIWPRLWLGVIVVATAASASLQMLSPFQWTPSYHSMGWFPLWGYYAPTMFEALNHVIELALLYFPLGFWLGSQERSRSRARLWAVGLTFVAALPIEYLQGWIVGRYPDVTDVGLSLCGAGLGAWAAGSRRQDVNVTPYG